MYGGGCVESGEDGTVRFRVVDGGVSTAHGNADFFKVGADVRIEGQNR